MPPSTCSRPASAGIPGAGIGRTVVEEVELGVVADPSPHRARRDLPGFGRPRGHAEVLAAILRVERLEAGADQHVLVGPGGVGAPDRLAGSGVERREPAAHAEFPAAVADEHLALHDEGRHGDRFAQPDLAVLLAPELLAGGGVEGDGLVVERIEEEPAICEGGAAIHHVAARHALGAGIALRVELPLHVRARLREVERIDPIRERGHDVHRVADHDRRGLVSLVDAGREAEGELQPGGVARLDLVERA
jgi:hypothetical protein